MKVIAQREDEDVYLISLEKDENGFVYDQEEELRYPPVSIEAILNRGYWIGIEDDPVVLRLALAAEEVSMPQRVGKK